MRSSKSRSRSKPNRPRTIGNIINRVFESSGPDGKVRGTPQQIIEKYAMLARDAQLSNDRVAAENFLQHAEHYTRMLGEAQREMAAEQEYRQAQQTQQGQQGGSGNAPSNGNGNGNGGGGGGQRPTGERFERRDDRGEYRGYSRPVEGLEVDDQPAMASFDARIPSAFVAVEDESGLVETPEARPARPPRDFDRNRDQQAPAANPEADRNPRAPRSDSLPPRKPRAPRKPRDDEADTTPDVVE